MITITSETHTHKSHRFSNRWNFKYYRNTHTTKIIFKEKKQFENNNVNKDNGREKNAKSKKTEAHAANWF